VVVQCRLTPLRFPEAPLINPDMGWNEDLESPSPVRQGLARRKALASWGLIDGVDLFEYITAWFAFLFASFQIPSSEGGDLLYKSMYLESLDCFLSGVDITRELPPEHFAEGEHDGRTVLACFFAKLETGPRPKSRANKESRYNARLLAKVVDRLLAKISSRVGKGRRRSSPPFDWSHAWRVTGKAFPSHTFDRLKRKYASQAVTFRESDKDGTVPLSKKRRRPTEKDGESSARKRRAMA